eukprot:scpid75656/ scgid4187/ 
MLESDNTQQDISIQCHRLVASLMCIQRRLVWLTLYRGTHTLHHTAACPVEAVVRTEQDRLSNSFLTVKRQLLVTQQKMRFTHLLHQRRREKRQLQPQLRPVAHQLASLKDAELVAGNDTLSDVLGCKPEH